MLTKILIAAFLLIVVLIAFRQLGERVGRQGNRHRPARSDKRVEKTETLVYDEKTGTYRPADDEG